MDGDDESITEEWLDACGFERRSSEFTPGKTWWVLWVGLDVAVPEGCPALKRDDIGIDLEPGRPGTGWWHCRLRGARPGLEGKSFHVRRMVSEQEVIDLYEAVTRRDWNPARRSDGPGEGAIGHREGEG